VRIGSVKIATAFINGCKARTNNTFTDGTAVYLHGNKIMWTEDGVIHFSLSGWNTATTRDRINTVLELLDKPFRLCQHRFDPYVYRFNGGRRKEISSNLPYSVDDFAGS
jgi:hypothetical protein